MMLPYWILQAKRIFKKAGDNTELGQTLVEYALILALVSIIITAVLVLLGVNLSDSYETIAQLFPDTDLFSKTLSIGYTKDEQGFIKWFIIDN